MGYLICYRCFYCCCRFLNPLAIICTWGHLNVLKDFFCCSYTYINSHVRILRYATWTTPAMGILEFGIPKQLQHIQFYSLTQPGCDAYLNHHNLLE